MADSCEHGNEPSPSLKTGNFLTRWMTISFSRRTLTHGAAKDWVLLHDNAPAYAAATPPCAVFSQSRNVWFLPLSGFKDATDDEVASGRANGGFQEFLEQYMKCGRDNILKVIASNGFLVPSDSRYCSVPVLFKLPRICGLFCSWLEYGNTC
jgi:hypothetical protein